MSDLSSSSPEKRSPSEAKNIKPGSLVAIVRPLQSDSSKEYSKDDSNEIINLSTLPSPMERSGSLIGDPQLPAPTEFCDVHNEDEEDDQQVMGIHKLRLLNF